MDLGGAPLLSLVPLDETVTLNVVYEFNTEKGRFSLRSPLSKSMTLREAIGHALTYSHTDAKVSITARGITYRDVREFRAIWARRSFFQQSQ